MKTLNFIAAIILVPCTMAWSDAFNLDKFLADMEKAEQNVQNVKFYYTQEIAFPLTGEKQVSMGQVVFMKPSNVWIKQTRPLEQTIISDGKKVWIYTPGYNQVITDNWKKWTKNSLIPDSLVNMGQNWKSLRGKYEFADAGLDGGSRVILLAPKKKENWHIKFWVSEKDYSVTRLVLSGENISITTQSDTYRMNSPIDKSIFRFSPPKGAEVLNLE